MMISPVNQTPLQAFSRPSGSEQASQNKNEAASDKLTSQETREVTQLKQRDREVKAHEQAHKQTGGRYVRGTIQYEYEKGPDGKQYAVGGEVTIDTSAVPGDPEATIEKMQTVRKAALAPAHPSAQDRRVASDALSKEMKAQRELAAEQADEKANTFETDPLHKAVDQYKQASSLNPNTAETSHQFQLTG